MNFFVEFIYGVSQLFFFSRLYFQTKQSLKEKRSVNPRIYWSLGILGNLFIVFYGFYTNAIVMVGTSSFGILYSIYHFFKFEDPEENPTKTFFCICSHEHFLTEFGRILRCHVCGCEEYVRKI